MASDQLVRAAVVLRSLIEVRRRGSWNMIADLENVEPDLAEYVMESATLIHQQLLEAGLSSKKTRTLDHAIRELVMVSITALRTSHLELWQRDIASGQVTEIDPPPNPTPPSSTELPPPSADPPLS